MISKGQQLKKNILVEEREFMRMERKLKKIGPQGGRGWTTTGTNEDNVVMNDEWLLIGDYSQKKWEMFGGMDFIL